MISLFLKKMNNELDDKELTALFTLPILPTLSHVQLRDRA